MSLQKPGSLNHRCRTNCRPWRIILCTWSFTAQYLQQKMNYDYWPETKSIFLMIQNKALPHISHVNKNNVRITTYLQLWPCVHDACGQKFQLVSGWEMPHCWKSNFSTKKYTEEINKNKKLCQKICQLANTLNLFLKSHYQYICIFLRQIFWY